MNSRASLMAAVAGEFSPPPPIEMAEALAQLAQARKVIRDGEAHFEAMLEAPKEAALRAIDTWQSSIIEERTKMAQMAEVALLHILVYQYQWDGSL